MAIFSLNPFERFNKKLIEQAESARVDSSGSNKDMAANFFVIDSPTTQSNCLRSLSKFKKVFEERFASEFLLVKSATKLASSAPFFIIIFSNFCTKPFNWPIRFVWESLRNCERTLWLFKLFLLDCEQLYFNIFFKASRIKQLYQAEMRVFTRLLFECLSLRKVRKIKIWGFVIKSGRFVLYILELISGQSVKIPLRC